MPYFVRVGPISANKSGLGARGYHVHRRGMKVIVTWGRVKVVPGRIVSFAWAWTTQHQVFPCASENAAKERLVALVEQRITRERYDRLPPGQKIARSAKSRESTERR